MRKPGAILLALGAIGLGCGVSLDAEASGFKSFRKYTLPQPGGYVPGVALYDSLTPPMATGITNPIPNGSTAWCLTAWITPNKDWSAGNGVADGLFQIGATLGASNSVTDFMVSNGNGTGDTYRLKNSAGSQTSGFVNSTCTIPFLYKQLHHLSHCYSNGYLSVYKDGAQALAPALASTSFTMPATLRIGDLGAATFPWGFGNFSRFCVSGPKPGALAGTDPSVTVDAACGEFTAFNDGSICYGCVASLGSTKVVALGDSITQCGASVFRPYPQKLNALKGTGYNVINAGISGNTVAQIKTRYEASYTSSGTYPIVTVLGGVNDLLFGTSAATTFVTLSALYDEIIANGQTLVPATVMPFKNNIGWSAAIQTQLGLLNASITTYASGHGLTLVDAYTGMGGQGGDAAVLLTIYDSGDHLHENQVGADAIAALFSPAVP